MRGGAGEALRVGARSASCGVLGRFMAMGTTSIVGRMTRGDAPERPRVRGVSPLLAAGAAAAGGVVVIAAALADALLPVAVVLAAAAAVLLLVV